MSILKTTEQIEASTICKKKIVTFTSYHSTTCLTKITVFIVFFACRLLVSFLVSKFTIKSLSINDVIQQQQLAALERHARARMYAPFALALEAVLARLWRQQSASDARQAVGGGMVQVDVT